MIIYMFQTPTAVFTADISNRLKTTVRYAAILKVFIRRNPFHAFPIHIILKETTRNA